MSLKPHAPPTPLPSGIKNSPRYPSVQKDTPSFRSRVTQLFQQTDRLKRIVPLLYIKSKKKKKNHNKQVHFSAVDEFIPNSTEEQINEQKQYTSNKKLKKKKTKQKASSLRDPSSHNQEDGYTFGLEESIDRSDTYQPILHDKHPTRNLRKFSKI